MVCLDGAKNMSYARASPPWSHNDMSRTYQGKPGHMTHRYGRGLVGKERNRQDGDPSMTAKDRCRLTRFVRHPTPARSSFRYP